MKQSFYLLLVLGMLLVSCTNETADNNSAETASQEQNPYLAKYVSFPLKTDISGLSQENKEMIRLMIQAAKIMDNLFWYQAYGDKEELLTGIEDADLKKFAVINYGPWDRLDGNAPFIPGTPAKPKGANFYPENMTIAEFEGSELDDKAGLYNFIRRNEDGSLKAVPYHEQFRDEINEVSTLLKKAAALADDEGLKNYLLLRADALLNDDYRNSDMAWLDMKENLVDLVIGPIETYEDQLFGYKASYEAYVLVKDKEWSQRLAKYADFLPELQQGLPVPDAYKQEQPGTDTELNAYDVIYYAGDCNAGSKTIAINLPNDEVVQLEKGTRRLQLKNAMRAKFDKILLPVSNVLIDESQRGHITFDAFFSNTMFHEVAHGLGIKNTINGKGTVRTALKEHASALEEGKADILGLYMIHQLHQKGELETDMNDFYVTFMASIFRSVRFGASSAHGKANMVRFNFFKEQEAFAYNPEKGTYLVNFEKMEQAMNALSEKILVLQGDGDYEKVGVLLQQYGKIGPELQKNLDRLSEQNIPVDIIFEQGTDVLGLE